MNKQECPVCGEKVDIDDAEAVRAHMNIDDEAHRAHKEVARKNMKVAQTNEVME
jgi:uncharacterized Zn finger protein (UPF0148 family)